MFWNYWKLSKKCFLTDYLKTYNKEVIKFCFRFISWIIKPRHRVYLTQPSPSVDNLDLGFDTSCYHVQTHPKIAYFCQSRVIGRIQNTKISKQLSLKLQSVVDKPEATAWTEHVLQPPRDEKKCTNTDISLL